MKTVVSIKSTKEQWKEELEGTTFVSVITNLMGLEKKTNDNWSTALMLCVAQGIGSVGSWDSASKKAATEALEAEYNRLVALADEPLKVAELKLEFYHQKDTKQHKAGSIKTSRLPVAWRSSVSMIRSAIEFKVTLIAPVYDVDEDGGAIKKNGKFVIIGYRPRAKAELMRLLKAAKNKVAVIEAEKNDTGEIEPDTTIVIDGGETSPGEDLSPLATLEILIKSCKDTLAKIEGDDDLEKAKLLVDSIWNLEPIKLAV